MAVPRAFIILAPSYQLTREMAQGIFKFTKERQASFKRLRRLEFSDLQKTVSGKIRRVYLRKHEEAKTPAGQRNPLEFFEEDF